MSQNLRLFPRPLGPHCGACRLLSACGSGRTDNACPPTLDLGTSAGPFQIHPLRTDFDEQLDAIGGVDFDDIIGRPLPRLPLPAYLPQARWRERLVDERLTGDDFPLISIRVKDVFRGGRIRSASEVREKLGLAADVGVVLLLHGQDELLERLDAVNRSVEIAAAGYALVTPPSFSLWEPRRRPNNLMSLRRSFLYYAEVLAAGGIACPRVGWVEALDAERLAKWVNEHAVSLVSLDLMTYGDRSFARVVSGLAHFDELTGQRVHYLVDGVASITRVAVLYLATASERLTVSSATMAPPAAKLGGTKTFRARVAVFSSHCAQARIAAAEADASSVEEFVARTLSTSRRGQRGFVAA